MGCPCRISRGSEYGVSRTWLNLASRRCRTRCKLIHMILPNDDRHLHVHVISGDLVSERLRHKKHYNSFRPDMGFFVHLDDVIARVKQGDRTVSFLLRLPFRL